MMDDRRKEQASLYALRSLPDVEVVEFEKALQSDRELKLLVGELQSSLDMMVFAFPRVAPPQELKPKTLHELDHRETTGYHLLRFPLAELRWRLWLPWALAAAMAWFGVVYFSANRVLRQQITSLNQQVAVLNRQIAEQGRQRDAWRNQGDQKLSELQQQSADLQKRLLQGAEAFEAEKTSLQSQLDQKLLDLQKEKAALQEQVGELTDENQRLAAALQTAQAELLAAQNRNTLAQIRVGMMTSLLETAPKAVAVSVWDSEQQKGLLLAENLAPLAGDQDYQLWLIDPRYPNPVSAGVFRADQQGNARFQFKTDFRVETVDKFFVSVERKGGVVRLQGKTVLVSN